MKIILTVLTVLLLTMIGNSMADFESAVNAYNSGDIPTAIKMLKQLSEQGDVESQYNLGKLYESGAGVDQNVDEAIRLYKLAAEAGDIEAQYRLGNLYHKGEGVERDYKEALKWWQLAAKHENNILGSISAFSVGTMYLYGEGVPVNTKEAEKWLETINDGSPRKIIAAHFRSMENELPIKGGWGYTKESACVIDKNDPEVDEGIPFDGVGVEYIFVEKRIYEEMIVTRPTGEAYSGAQWKLSSQELLEENGRNYDHMIFSVTAFHDKDWEELKAEWEGRENDPQFSKSSHDQKRNKAIVNITREFWFDITSFYGQDL